MGQVT